MKYSVQIRNTITKEEKIFVLDSYSDEDVVHSVWWVWNEGFYSCDCNRRTLFYGEYHDGYYCTDTEFVLDWLCFENEYHNKLYRKYEQTN